MRSRRIAAMVVVSLAVATPAFGQDSTRGSPPAVAGGSSTTSPQSSATADSTRALSAPVVLRGDTLFVLYGSLGPFSASDRAGAVSERLRQVGTPFGKPIDSIHVVEREGRSELVMGDLVVMTVLDADAAPRGLPRPTVAAEYAQVIAQAVGESARRVSARALGRAIGYAGLATIALFVLLRLIAIGFPRVYRRMEAVRRLRVPALRIQQFEIASAERISRLLLGAARVVRIALTILLLYFYVPLVLSFFPWTVSLSRQIVGYAIAPVGTVWAGFLAYVPNVFYVAVIVLVTRYVLKVTHAIFQAMGNSAIHFQGFYPEWAEPTYKIVRVLILAFAAVVVFPYLPGSHTDAFKGVSLFLGVLFSLGSSSAVANVVAGTVLTYTRAFRIGDRVRIGETVGDVTEKTLLVTRIRTPKNVEITIPNSAVLGSQVLNYTTLATRHGLILHTTVTIGYDVPWQRVHAMLLTAASRTDHIMRDPAPFVLQTSLDDFYVRYELNAPTDRADLMLLTYSRLHANIQDAFNEEGVEIMSSHYGALRDGNATTVPSSYLAPSYRVPAFRVERAPNGDSQAPAPPSPIGESKPTPTPPR